MSDKPQEGTGRRRILIVEDDKLMQTFYVSLFRKVEDEFTCRLEGNGKDAVDYLRRHSVDGVILDWDLPGIKGIDVLKAIRSDRVTCDLPVLIVTGRDGEQDKARALREGASGYLTKPFDVADLLKQLRELPPRPAL